jgi:anti-sigma B factor antagonist
VECPVCHSVRIVVILDGQRRAFCSNCGARWDQRGSEQTRVMRLLRSVREGEVGMKSLLKIEPLMEGQVGLRLAGELDISSAPELTEALRPMIIQGGEVLLDCAALAFMDSAGFRVLIEVSESLPEGGRLVLLAPGPQITRTFELLGLEKLQNVEIREEDLDQWDEVSGFSSGAAGPEIT